ncbi:glycosyltransferase family 2 protein [Anaerovibrio sp.]|uniref:glycosyltransferase family 2 protein n=1 Tax=Anaerovibrio sp. TaxID=1872532 RepID=UPI00388D235A
MKSDISGKQFVSVLLVTRNEQDYIEKALMSLVNQTYPKDQYEIIIIDGESTDDTLKIISHIIEQYKTETFDIRIINNSKQILASGWNLGIKAARGDYVVRIDAHAEAAMDFIEKNIETMQRVTDAVCVGGKIITKSLKDGDESVSKVLSSAFGVGNSPFRVSDEAGYADTAVYGLYKKDIFKKVGYFNEQFVRNQDIELHSRIKAVGGKFYFNPQICCVYYTRNTVGKMIKQALGNGKWNMVLLKQQGSALSLRHLVPFAFVLFLIGSTICGFFYDYIWLFESMVLLLYVVLGIVASIRKTSKVFEVIKMVCLFFLLHISYGVGYLKGIFTSVAMPKWEERGNESL